MSSHYQDLIGHRKDLSLAIYPELDMLTARPGDGWSASSSDLSV